jgi:hypothetical protein
MREAQLPRVCLSPGIDRRAFQAVPNVRLRPTIPIFPKYTASLFMSSPLPEAAKKFNFDPPPW